MLILSEEKLDQLIHDCSESGNYTTLKQTLWDVFSSSESLGASWPKIGAVAPATPPVIKACDTDDRTNKRKENLPNKLIPSNVN